MSNLMGLLIDRNIHMVSHKPGRNEHIRCPKCDGGRTREKSLSVTIDADGEGARWICHRASCGWQDGVRVGWGEKRRRPHLKPDVASEPDWMWQWFAERKIGAKTVDAFGVYATSHYFPQLNGQHQAIVFPFTWRGELMNRKYRAEPGKKAMAQDKDATQTIFNLDRALTYGELVWVEGELDVLALHECGVLNGVTLPNGAPAKEERSDKRYEPLTTHKDELAQVKRIILAGDVDKPGRVLRDELARRLGKHRCLTVDWPGGCKDANETLIQLGPDAVVEAIGKAQPYPIEGLYRITPEVLEELANQPPPPTMTTGTGAIDAILKLPTEGRLLVLTGWPNHGKSQFLRHVMLRTAYNHGRKWAMFSPEMQPWPLYAAECVEWIAAKQFWSGGLTKEERDAAAEQLRDSVVMLGCDAIGESPTVEWVLRMGEAAVLQFGCTDLAIDPWNEIDMTRAHPITETEFIGQSLQKFKAFAARHGCNVWVVAHPAKPIGKMERGEKRPPPGPYDIAGSAMWANRTDLGLTIHSRADGKAELRVWKSRSKRWGKRDTTALLTFDRPTGRYGSDLSQEIPDTGRYWE